MLNKPVCPGRSARAGRNCSALLSLVAAALLAVIPSCSLGNIDQAACTSNDECVVTIGPNSQCTNGYCTDPPSCVTGHDCRINAGGGACVSGYCVSAFPKDPQCSEIVEPSDLLETPLAGPDAPLVIGSIFSLGELKDRVLTESVRLAVDEITTKGGRMNRGKRLAVVVCDNGGPMNSAQGPERQELTNKAVDYLAGTLGVPYIVGPLSSADSLNVIARLKEKNYPTVVISPSATSPTLTDADDLPGNGNPGLFWRTCPSDVLQGKVMATNVIAMDASITKVAVIYSNDAYGQGLSTVFRDSYGLNMSAIFPVDDAQFDDATAMTNLANQVNAYGPNGVLVITVRAGNTVKVLEALVGTPAATAEFFFTDGAKDADALLNAPLAQPVKDIINGAIGTAPASPSGNVYETFKASFNAKWMRDADGFSFTAQAYDATYVGAYGVIWASRQNDAYDGNQVIQGMLKLSMGTANDISLIGWSTAKTALGNDQSIDVKGASGELAFNADTGEAPGKIEIWNVVNGKFNTANVIDPVP
jgi:branched-chain amino acid transport system substrate-binding protein